MRGRDPRRAKNVLGDFQNLSPHHDSDLKQFGIFSVIAAPVAEKNPANSKIFARTRGARYVAVIWPAFCDIPRGTFSARKIAPNPSVITVKEGRL